MKDLLSGTWLGHPVHPLLTDVPIGAWTSALLLDLMGIFGGAGAASRQGADTLVAVGVVAALPTTVSGLSDLSDEVDDSILAVGAAHAICNVAAVGLFTASYAARLRGRRVRGIALSVLGAGVHVAGNDVLLYRTKGAVYALANRCSHRGGPLHEGKFEGQEIVCPWHFSRFRMTDGSVVQGPAVAPQPCYETRVHEGKIEIRSRA